jgi:hypothetical protein
VTEDRSIVALKMLDAALAVEIPRVLAEDCDFQAAFGLQGLLTMRAMDAMRRVDDATGSTLAGRYVPLAWSDQHGRVWIGWQETSLDWDPAEDVPLQLNQLAPFPEDDELVEEALDDLRPFLRRHQVTRRR